MAKKPIASPDKVPHMPGGFPNFKRHLAAIHRMPPTHAGSRKFHASDVIYAMLRHGVGKSLLRRAGSGPMQDSLTAEKAKAVDKMPKFKKLTSNTLWGSILKKPM